jgi:MGT family glycosyltransferase
MRVLGVSFPIIGHITPMLGPMAELRRRGHEVSLVPLPFIPSERIRHWVESFGVTVCAVDFARLETALPDASEFVAIYLDVDRYIEFVRDLYVEAAGEQVRPLCAFIQDWKPDVMLNDTLLAQAYMASSLEDIPSIGFPGNLRALRQGGHWSPQDVGSDALTEDRRRIFRSVGLPLPPVRMNHILSPYQNVIPATADILPRDVVETLPESMVLAGPTPPAAGLGEPAAFPWAQLAADRPKVYVSFGTVIGGRPEIFAKLEAVCADLHVQIILTDGGNGARYSLKHRDANIFVDYAPQRELLKVCDVFVTHGGANSFADGIEAATPMLVIPFFTDQFDQAHYVERLGIGLQLRRDEVTEASLAAALARLLDDKQAMRARMRTMRRSDPDESNRTVADLAERLARRSREA